MLRRFQSYLFLIVALLLAGCWPAANDPSPPAPAPTGGLSIDVSGSPVPLNSDSRGSSSSSSSQPANPLPLVPTIAPIQGGEVILGLIGRPDSLNPISDTHPALDDLAPLLFDTLLQTEPDSAILQPGLAKAWDYSEDGRQVTFHLPPDLKWSNGEPLTSESIAESLLATQHPALSTFSDISAPDDETLVLSFTRIDCGALATLALLPLLPAGQVLHSVPAGSGPFMVEEWSENKRTLSLVPNPAHHGTEARLDQLIVRFVTEDEIAVALSEGQFDVIGPIQRRDHLFSPGASTAGVTNYIDLTYPAPQMVYVAINFAPKNKEALGVDVRQALISALDRQAILDELLGESGQLLGGSLLPGHWAAADNLSPPAYDLELAEALLAKAGLEDTDGDGWLDRSGERLELSIRANGENSMHQQLAWLVSSYYRDVGLFARAEGVPFDSLVDDLFTHDFSLAVFSWRMPADPDQRPYWRSTENIEGFGLNFTSYDNSELDDLLDRAVSVPGCALAKRAELYHQAQQILANDRPVDFLLAPYNHLLVAHRLEGLRPGPFAAFTWNAAEWRVLEN